MAVFLAVVGISFVVGLVLPRRRWGRFLLVTLAALLFVIGSQAPLEEGDATGVETGLLWTLPFVFGAGGGVALRTVVARVGRKRARHSST